MNYTEIIRILRMYNIPAEIRKFDNTLHLTGNTFIGKGVSLVRVHNKYALNKYALSLTGWWATLPEAQEHLIALMKGITLLESLNKAEGE